MAKKTNIHRGSSFDTFLEEEGILEEVDEMATKKLLAYQLEQAREAKNMTLTALAAAAGTSRSQVSRVLNPANNQVSIAAVRRVAGALGKSVRFELV